MPEEILGTIPGRIQVGMLGGIHMKMARRITEKGRKRNDYRIS